MEEGRAVESVTITNVQTRGDRVERVRVKCPKNWSKFRAGSRVLIHRGEPRGAPRARITSDDELEFDLVPDYQSRLEGLEAGPGWILDEAQSDFSGPLLDAVDQLGDGVAGRRIAALIEGSERPSFDGGLAQEANAKARAGTMDPYQTKAFVEAFTAEDFALIHGPPGSGKTWVLARLAAALAGRGERVLVTAVSHRAINHALRTIQNSSLGTPVYKVGDEEVSHDELETVSKVSDIPEDSGFVAGATSLKKLPWGYFRTAIFDEASQFTIPLAVRGMLAAQRFIFVGDEQQMAPIIQGEHTNPMVRRSIFEQLRQHHPGSMLQTTYRMNTEINRFPSARFYGGKLLPSPEAAGRRLVLQRPPRTYADILDPNRPAVFVDVPHGASTIRSLDEAHLAAGIVREAVWCGVRPDEIAVITPFRAQERLIKNLLGENRPTEARLRDVVVDTVERIQGQEKDLAILSLTTSRLDDTAEEAMDFFYKPTRLNVAITRARRKRIVLASPNILAASPPGALRGWVENFRALAQDGYRVSHTNAPPRPVAS